MPTENEDEETRLFILQIKHVALQIRAEKEHRLKTEFNWDFIAVQTADLFRSVVEDSNVKQPYKRFGMSIAL